MPSKVGLDRLMLFFLLSTFRAEVLSHFTTDEIVHSIPILLRAQLALQATSNDESKSSNTQDTSLSSAAAATQYIGGTTDSKMKRSSSPTIKPKRQKRKCQNCLQLQLQGTPVRTLPSSMHVDVDEDDTGSQQTKLQNETHGDEIEDLDIEDFELEKLILANLAKNKKRSKHDVLNEQQVASTDSDVDDDSNDSNDDSNDMVLEAKGRSASKEPKSAGAALQGNVKTKRRIGAAAPALLETKLCDNKTQLPSSAATKQLF